ncbi:hypothetical protein [Intestinimonas massiliensis (ex Afouda et al. 2020)]|uniref:hypothetical protein n=1 Tax=Intestinimonas massiliensis (ex Afouda et al. 2020) TaxID=1673721 RepID=UPI0010326266|nr:hypothetical protein [Intestinimonas massiliensis (ex Afouda et al. 2020)]
MPSDKKRINLTVPDPLYERLQQFKEKNGIVNDATACLQLITQQLNSQDQSEVLMNLLRETSLDTLMQLSNDGLAFSKEAFAKKLEKSGS